MLENHATELKKKRGTKQYAPGGSALGNFANE